jgi:hypothetical protein
MLKCLLISRVERASQTQVSILTMLWMMKVGWSMCFGLMQHVGKIMLILVTLSLLTTYSTNEYGMIFTPFTIWHDFYTLHWCESPQE